MFFKINYTSTLNNFFEIFFELSTKMLKFKNDLKYNVIFSIIRENEMFFNMH